MIDLVDIENLELGALEVFRKEIESSYSLCAAACHSADDCLSEANGQSLAKVFLPILLRRLYDASRLVLAATLNNDGCNKTAASKNRFRDARQTIKLMFPILENQLTNTSAEWIHSTANIVRRWRVDKQSIASTFFDKGSVGHLVSLQPGRGDEHDGGEQTLVLMLSCGRKVVYKPRCQRIEERFYVIARRLGFSELYTPRFICKERYGWMEFIPNVECKNADEVQAYYFRSGLLLSLLYALEAEDIHHENVISSGSHPVVVDLETLFHHRDDSVAKGNAGDICLSLGNHTVLKTHFVPQFFLRSPDDDLAAVFPLNGRRESAKRSVPRISGIPIPVDEFVQVFLEGFRIGYRRILSQKKVLLETDGPLSIFRGTSGRYVCRATRTYRQLISALAHPDLQADAAKRCRMIDKLEIDVCGRELLNEVLTLEKNSISKRQVPRFSHQVDRTAVFIDGTCIDSNFFAISGINLAKIKIGDMDEADLAGQIQLIRRSFALECRDRLHLPPPVDGNLTMLCKSVGIAIGRIVLRSGMHHQSGRIWPLHTVDSRGAVCLDPTSSSLYQGYLGVSLFLANAQSIFPALCERKELIDLAKCQVRQSIHSYSNHQGCGGFTGSGGILYTLTHFARLWPTEEWVGEYANLTLSLLADQRESDDRFDVVSGSAGAILALLAHYKQSGEDRALQVAIKYGDHLLTKSGEAGQVGWLTVGRKVLTGFGHGTAGIGYALKSLSAASGIARFNICADEALDRESHLFMPDQCNWPDNRLNDSSAHEAMTAWCHGAVGIGLSRLKIRELVCKPQLAYVDADIQRSLSHYLRRPFSKNNSLCHGTLGNFELPMAARSQSMMESSQWSSLVERLRRRVLSFAKIGAIRSDMSKYVDYSLMTGWSGIGYQLLRISGVGDMPNLLLLDASSKRQ